MRDGGRRIDERMYCQGPTIWYMPQTAPKGRDPFDKQVIAGEARTANHDRENDP
jgi:hypothetical protein